MAKKTSLGDLPQVQIDPTSGLTEPSGTSLGDVPVLGYDEPIASQHEPVQFYGEQIGKPSRYDTNLTADDLDGLERERALHQPTSHKAFNALVGGVASGVLTAVEDFGYIPEIAKHLMGIDHNFSNGLTEAMKEAKAGLEEGMPIHRQTDQVFDWSDPGFYWSSIKGILDSAIGFAIPGMAASKAVGKAAKMAKLGEVLKMTKGGEQIANSLGAGFITNSMEGMMMASEQFENSKRDLEQKLFEQHYMDVQAQNVEGQLDPREVHAEAVNRTMSDLDGGKRAEYEKIAGEQADAFMLRNRAFMLTDAIGLHGIHKTKGSIRNILSAKGLKTSTKRLTTLGSDNLILQGAKEGAEEIGQNIAQMEGEDLALQQAGYETDSPEAFYNRAMDFGTSDKALLEGMMGIFGGGPQRILTEAVSGNFSRGGQARYRNQFQKQQAQIKINEEYVKSKLSNFAEGQKIRQEAIRRGDDNIEGYAKAIEYLGIVSDNLDRGTIENLEELLQDVANMTPEQAADQGYSENYKQEATDQLKTLAEMEKSYAKLGRFENQGELFDNRQTRELQNTERQKAKESLEEVEYQLEEDPTNPELLAEKKYLTNAVETTTKNITELDKEYKHKTTSKYQQDERKRKRDEAKQIREVDKKVKNLKKEHNDQKKADDRQARKQKQADEKKAKEEKKADTKEPDTQVEDTAAEPVVQDDLVEGPPEDGGVDPVKEQEMTEKQIAGKGKFKDSSGELLDEIASLAPEAEQSEAQRMVGLLEKMVSDLKEALGRDNVDFAEVVDALIEEHGVGKVEPIFGQLEALHKLTDKTYESVNYLSEFRRLTPNDEKELETAEKRGEEADKGQFTEKTEELNNKENEELEGAIGRKNTNETDEEGHNDADYRKVISGSNILAYLSRKLDRLWNGIPVDVDNVINEEMDDKFLLDPYRYGEGTKVTLVVQNDGTTPVYINGKQDIWQTKLDELDTDLANKKITKEQYQQAYEEQVPIAIHVDGKRVAYLHETEWINEKNVSGDVEKDKERSRKARKAIVAADTYDTVVTSKSHGYLWRNTEGEATLDEAMGDETLPIVVGANGGYKSDRITDHAEDGMLNNSSPREGTAYVVLPIGDDSIAIPLNNKKIGTENGIANTIVTAMEVFLGLKEDNDLVKYIHDNTEAKINITTSNGIAEFIKMYVNTYNTGDIRNLKTFLKNVPNHVSKGGNMYMSIIPSKDGSDAYFQIARGDGVAYKYLSRENVKKLSEADKAKYLQGFRDQIPQMYSHVNLNHLNANENVVIISEEGSPTTMSYNQYVRRNTTTPFLSHNLGTDENPNWIYTLQPVVEIDLSRIDGTGPTQAEQDQMGAEAREFDDATGEERFEEQAVGIDKIQAIKDLWLEIKRKTSTSEKVAQEEFGKINFEYYNTISDNKLNEAHNKLLKKARKLGISKKTTTPPAAMPKFKRGGGRINYDDLESKSELEEEENQIFLRLLNEYSAEDVTPERKAELQPIIFQMYYGDTGMVTLTEKRNQARRKMGKPELESESAEPLTDDQVAEMKRLAEARIEDKTLKGVLISQLGATRQEHIVSFLRGEIVNALFVSKNAKTGKIYAQIKSDFESDIKTAEDFIKTTDDEAVIAELERRIKEMNLILDNWTVITAIVDQEVERIDSVKKVIVDDVEIREETDSGAENENWTEHQNDPSDGLATQIKQFLSGIRQYDKNGEVVLTYWGDEKTMSYQDMYNILQKLTPNLRPNFDEMIQKLEDIAADPDKIAVYPFMPELIKKLREAPQQVKNQFVSGMTNHDNDMRFIMFSRDQEGNTKLVEHQSNANSKAQVIQGEWYGALLAGGVTKQVGGGEIIIAKPEGEELVATWQKWKDSDDMTKHHAEMRMWLTDIGINVSDQTWKDLVDGKVEHGGKPIKFANQVKLKSGVFGALANNIKERISGDEAISLTTGDKLLDQGVIKALARHEAEYALYSFGQSHRTGDRTVYSYSQNKYLVNRVRDLKDYNNGSNPLIDELARLSFNKGSKWLEEMNKNGGKNAFHDNFNRWVFSLEPLKKQGSKSKGGAELHNLSSKDIEIAKIGMIQGVKRDMTNNRNRVIQLVYPTTSDKTTVMGLTVLAADLDLDMEGNITDASVQTLFDRIVRSEIRRIHSIQDKDGVNLEAYTEGGQQFLFFPEINKIPGVFDGDGKLSQNIEGPEMIALMKEKVKEYFDNLVQEKLQMWEENGIIGKKESFLNKAFMNIKVASQKGSVTAKNPLSGVNEESRERGAAADMVFQYLIGNAEMAMTFTGDPALYFKVADKNFVAGNRKSITDPTYDFVADAKATYINVGKRLAADIAPGYEIADAYDDNYVQGFIADRKSASRNAVNITKLLDGAEAATMVEEQLNKLEKKEISKKQFITSIKKLKSAPYYAIASADAQEYTTWREHLHVMYKAGELSEEEYNTGVKVLSSNNPVLDKKLLGKVMQPMKPVYVNNVIQDGMDVERRMYIKSSAFPLLPQLTVGTDLDNLRQAMERKGGPARVAFGTAVKVGNVTKENQANIFDDQGRILPADQIDFTNATMTLNRRGFRIQQRVPYEAGKAEINKVTQASKNLFINMLTVENFMYKDKPYTGQELQEKYHEMYDEIHKIERDKLMAEVTNPDGKTLNRFKLRETLLTEALDRNYPISDQELLHIDKELEFLAFSPSADKYESLLNSIVTNRVIKLTMPGKSFVLGSEDGFQSVPMTKEEVDEVTQAGIVYTDNWTGELLPMREGVNSKGEKVMLPAQAIVPWKMKDSNGVVLKISDYTTTKKDGTVVIDSEKVPSDILRLFGMRIPNQGPNSQSMIEIVGFLPELSGDLIIATKDYVVQMGSDFDVDKLYTYMYNLSASDGKLYKQSRSGGNNDQRVRVLQNNIIDVHMGIHENVDPKVQEQIATPLGFWILDDLAKDVEKWRSERQTTEEQGAGLVRTQKFIRRQDLKNNPDKLYLFGDNLEKKGLGGQAKEMRGEPNALGIPTKKKPSMGEDAFFTDDEYEENTLYINEAFDSIPEGRIIIMPEDGFGTGLANLKEKAPKTFAFLQTKVAGLGRKTAPRKMFTGLSDEYQREKFKNATAGKAGVGSFSVDSMFNAVAQGKGLLFTVPIGGGERAPLTVVIGDKTSRGKLSSEVSLDEKTYISDVIAGYQSAAVDNEKEQILDKLNINTHTFKVIKILNQLGFTEEVPLFVAQDIIVDYVKELERLSSTIGSYVPNKEETAMKTVLAMDQYTLKGSEIGTENDKQWAGKEATPEVLTSFIKKGDKALNYRVTQRALLEKFIELNEYGVELQTVQSTINPDSRGVGKSVMESQLKEDQVFRLGSSAVDNAFALLGDVYQVESVEEEDRLRNEGYTIKTNGGITFAIKPTTINGQAIVYGLFTANELWSALFPYKNSGIDGIMNKIEYLTGNKSQTQVSSQAEKRHEVWNSIKSFIYSDEALGLITEDSTVVDERIRLLQDKWETQDVEDGDVITTREVKSKDSLAAFLQNVKQTPFGQKNSFLVALEAVVEKGNPSTVRYRASSAEKPNEVNYYIGVLQLLEDDSVITDEKGEPVLFNGEQYTGKKLMQDLVLYAYITGGVQEAVQFVKYIPAAYLKAIGQTEEELSFADRIAQLSHTDEAYGVVDKNALTPRQYVYHIPAFVEQFFQHHPEKVPQLEETDIYDGDAGFKNATSFRINKEARDRTGKRIVENFVEVYVPHPYVTLRTGSSKKGLKLFKYVTKGENSGKYVQIDTLGTLGVSEYNRGVPVNKNVSLIPLNKAHAPKDIQPEVVTPDTFIADTSTKPAPKPVEQPTGDDFLNKVKRGGNVTYQGVEKANSILESMLTSDNSHHVALAEELMKHTDQLPTDIKFVISNESGQPAGKYGHVRQEVVMFSKSIGPQGKNATERVFLHELVHGMTGHKILAYEQIENDGPHKEFAEEVIKKIPNFELTDKDRAAIKSIKVLMNMARTKILADPALKAKFDTYAAPLRDPKDSFARGEAKVGKVYGLTDTLEFVSEALTNPVFQELLNQMTAPSGKTFWQTLKERLTKLFESLLGTKLEKGSVLEAAVYDIFDLMTDEQQDGKDLLGGNVIASLAPPQDFASNAEVYERIKKCK